MFFKCLLFVCLSMSSSCFGQELVVGDKCTSDGVEGVCKIALLCDPAVKSIKKQDFHTFKRCGFVGLDEIVCCIEDGFGNRAAEPTTELLLALIQPSKASSLPNGAPVSYSVPIMKEKPLRSLRKAERECERIKKMVSPPLNSYIIGGDEALSEEFPHMVSVAYIDEDKEKVKEKGLEFLCGGALISERFVLSAAHCFQEIGLRSRKPSLVRVGVTSLASNLYNPATDYNISRIVAHPKFKKHSYDIALVELARPVPVTDAAHPGCLYTREELPKHAIVTGWGIVDYTTKIFSETLQKVNLTIVSHESCVEKFRSRSVNQLIEENMLCAGDESGKDACQGDSGGPLQALSEKDGHFRIIGIVSFGVLCGTKIPGVYSRVSSHLDWIESVAWP